MSFVFVASFCFVIEVPYIN